MATTFNEDNTIEQMIISTLKSNGWKYIPAEELPRMHSDVLVEPMVKEALIRLNPEIAEDPSRADEVIYKLRTVILSVQPHNLVTQNEVSFFRGDMRKILITTIFKFGEVSGELNARNNIIVMVDEAHRTQEGDLGEKMRMALPNAFFFGLTGTPINRVDKNTFATFGAEEDRTGYY